jgi:hypothetical protein
VAERKALHAQVFFRKTQCVNGRLTQVRSAMTTAGGRLAMIRAAMLPWARVSGLDGCGDELASDWESP